MADASGGLRHAFQTQVGWPGEDGGDQCYGIAVQAPGAQIGEGVEETCLGIDVPQQVGDANTRHQDIDGVIKPFGGGWRDRIIRGDLETAAFEAHAIDMAAEER